MPAVYSLTQLQRQGIKSRKTYKPFQAFFWAMTRKFTTQTNAAGQSLEETEWPKGMSKELVDLNYELVYRTHIRTHTYSMYTYL